ncbi:MAG TPA: RNA polymerase factor sigma-54 [Devosiaceae bacterium]|nr:RNA polymerase factor sigma-54 [Devosiaceae bacterium]
MALAPRIEVRQSQSLTLTPQLMQSIRLLQLSHLELDAFIDTELLRNPLLEREEGERDLPGEADQQAEPTEIAADAHQDTLALTERVESAADIADSYDTDVESVFPEQSGQDAGGDAPTNWTERHGGNADGAPDLDQFTAARPRLSDHLEQQIGFILADPAERLVARYLIDGLNEAGYLTAELGGIAEQLGAPLELVKSVLGRIQGCDPIGVFARDVPECLALQLREKDRLDPMMSRLLQHLDLLAGHDLAALCRQVGCDRDDLADMLAEIRQLDPRPGLAFDAGPIEAIVPDVFVRHGPGEEWGIELNTEILPRVLVNRTYYASVTKKTRDAAEKSFLTDCLASANWLTKSLDQRAQTILKVAAEIVQQQENFLRHGITHLKPMTLKMVAEAIEMHESTVSRVTSNKYMATPRGLFEMKYFFTTALGSMTGGGDHSAETVRHRIRQLIDLESPSEILSDDTIAELLQKEQGVDVARRTVAKYREGMNIPSSVVRRRQKRQMAGAR